MVHLHPANQARHDRATKVDRAVDRFVGAFGSLTFVIWQTLFIIVWIALNVMAFVHHWDPYPFILLNLMFSTQAAYAAPLILLSQNRQSEHDRQVAEHTAEFVTEIRSMLEVQTNKN